MQDVPVIDADGHVLETDAELEQYFDGPYKGHRRSGVFSIFLLLTVGRVALSAVWTRSTAPRPTFGSSLSKAQRSMPLYCIPRRDSLLA